LGSPFESLSFAVIARGGLRVGKDKIRKFLPDTLLANFTIFDPNTGSL
jgi:hypothetical protein